jgi:hypothetical protein
MRSNASVLKYEAKAAWIVSLLSPNMLRRTVPVLSVRCFCLVNGWRCRNFLALGLCSPCLSQSNYPSLMIDSCPNNTVRLLWVSIADLSNDNTVGARLLKECAGIASSLTYPHRSRISAISYTAATAPSAFPDCLIQAPSHFVALTMPFSDSLEIRSKEYARPCCTVGSTNKGGRPRELVGWRLPRLRPGTRPDSLRLLRLMWCSGEDAGVSEAGRRTVPHCCLYFERDFPNKETSPSPNQA